MSNEPKKLPYVWIALLAFVAVGLRNFEPGLSTDGPLYAAISRNIARTGEFFFLYGGTPDFHPFTEHPHLVFWIQAAFLKFLPDQDWAARIPNHLFYVGFLILLFRSLKKAFSEEAAILGVFLLFTLSRFSNWFSTTYLDPACLFFGFVAISSLQDRKFLQAGFSLGAAFMAKGLAALGFLPAFAFLLLARSEKKAAPIFKAFLSFLVLLLVYYVAIKQSQVPDFFERYWNRQVSSRFQARMDWEPVFRKEFWTTLLRDSQGLLILMLGSLWAQRILLFKAPFLVTFWILFVSFTVMLASKNRIGGQYWVMVFPWMTAVIAVAVTTKWPNVFANVRDGFLKWTTVLAITIITLAQFLPIRTHSFQLNEELVYLRKISKEGFKKVHYDSPEEYPDFLVASPMSWYGDVEVLFCDRNKCEVPQAISSQLYILRGGSLERERALVAAGWCERNGVRGSSAKYFAACK